MPKHFIKINGSTAPKNKLQEGISYAIAQLDQTLWPDLETAKFAVYTNFDNAVANYTGKCTAPRPSGAETSPGTFTFWICEMITLSIYEVKYDYSEPVPVVWASDLETLNK